MSPTLSLSALVASCLLFDSRAPTCVGCQLSNGQLNEGKKIRLAMGPAAKEELSEVSLVPVAMTVSATCFPGFVGHRALAVRTSECFPAARVLFPLKLPHP